METVIADVWGRFRRVRQGASALYLRVVLTTLCQGQRCYCPHFTDQGTEVDVRGGAHRHGPVSG